MEKIVLTDRNGLHDLMEEEKYIFLRNILLSMNLQGIEEVMPENNKVQTVNQRIAFRQLLRKFNLYTFEQRDILEVYLDNQKIAWIKKKFVLLKQDPKEIDPGKKNYLEVTLEFEHPF